MSKCLWLFCICFYSESTAMVKEFCKKPSIILCQEKIHDKHWSRPLLDTSMTALTMCVLLQRWTLHGMCSSLCTSAWFMCWHTGYFLRFYFYFEVCVNVHVSEYGYVHMRAVALEASSNSLGAQAIGRLEPPHKGTGNQIQDLWKNSGHS